MWRTRPAGVYDDLSASHTSGALRLFCQWAVRRAGSTCSHSSSWVRSSKLRSLRGANVKRVPSATDSEVTRRRTVLASWTRRLESAISLASWRSGLMVNSSTSRSG